MLTICLALIDDPEDQDTFTQLYQLYRARMMHIAEDILHDRAEAEDAVQNAFIGIARNIHRIADPTDHAAFLYVAQAAKHAAINLAQKKGQCVFLEDAIAETASIAGPEREYMDRERYRRLLACIAEMSPTYRTVLYYHFVEEMTAREIADLLGQTLSCTKQRLVRGKQLLINKIEEEWAKDELPTNQRMDQACADRRS